MCKLPSSVTQDKGQISQLTIKLCPIPHSQPVFSLPRGTPLSTLTRSVLTPLALFLSPWTACSFSLPTSPLPAASCCSVHQEQDVQILCGLCSGFPAALLGTGAAEERGQLILPAHQAELPDFFLCDSLIFSICCFNAGFAGWWWTIPLKFFPGCSDNKMSKKSHEANGPCSGNAEANKARNTFYLDFLELCSLPGTNSTIKSH